LIALSGHVKVWISYASFEAEPIPIPRALREEEDEDAEESEAKVVAGDPVLARQVFERGYKDLKGKGLKSEVDKPPLHILIGIDRVLTARGIIGCVESVRGEPWVCRGSRESARFDADSKQAACCRPRNWPDGGRCV
jgi:hypothetical protein